MGITEAWGQRPAVPQHWAPLPGLAPPALHPLRSAFLGAPASVQLSVLGWDLHIGAWGELANRADKPLSPHHSEVLRHDLD